MDWLRRTNRNHPGDSRVQRRLRDEFQNIQQSLKEKLKKREIENYNGKKFFRNRAAQDVFGEEEARLSGLYHRFLKYHNVYNSSTSEKETTIFVERAVGKPGHALKDYISITVAVLICISAEPDDIAWIRVATSINDRRWGQRPLTDDQRPLIDDQRPLTDDQRPLTDAQPVVSHIAALPLFGNNEERSQAFLTTQTTFREVVVLYGRECTIYERTSGDWYLPYEEYSSLDSRSQNVVRGSSIPRPQGGIYKVTVSRGHFITRDRRPPHDITINPNHNRYAMKELLQDRPGNRTRVRNELIINDLIGRDENSSKFVAYAAAALSFSDKICIFTELAHSNLAQYMEQRKPQADPLDDVQQMIDVAEAIDYIHNRLRLPDQRHVVCCHLDIKLENILVHEYSIDDIQHYYGPHQAPYILKLVDFGLSQLLTSDNDGYRAFDAVQWYAGSGSSILSLDESAVIPGVGAFSTCVTPEGIRHEALGPEADVWAYACILTIFTAWLISGQLAPSAEYTLSAFKERRILGNPSGRGSDAFAVKITSVDWLDVQLNPAVSQWFDATDTELRHRQHPRAEFYGDLHANIREHMLCVQLSARWNIMDIQESLEQLDRDTRGRRPQLYVPRDVINTGNVDALANATAVPAPGGFVVLNNVVSSGPMLLPSRPAREGSVNPLDLSAGALMERVKIKLEVPPDCKATLISPNQRFFGFLYDDAVRIFEVDNVLANSPSPTPLPGIVLARSDAKFEAAVLTDDHLWIAQSVDNISFLLYRLPQLNNPPTKLARTVDKPSYKVLKIAAHPTDSAMVACLVKFQKVIEIHMFRLTDNEQLDLNKVPQVLNVAGIQAPPSWIRLQTGRDIGQPPVRNLTLFYSLDCNYLILAEAKSGPEKIIRYWQLHGGDRQGFATLTDVGRGRQVGVQNFSAHAAFENCVIVQTFNSQLSLLDLTAPQGVNVRATGNVLVGPVFSTSDGSDSFIVQLSDEGVAVARLARGTTNLHEIEATRGTGLEFRRLMFGRSCHLAWLAEMADSRILHIMVVGEDGRGFHFKTLEAGRPG